jgi:hypothetical protein
VKSSAIAYLGAPMNRLAAMEVFVRVIDTGSFSGAEHSCALGSPQSRRRSRSWKSGPVSNYWYAPRTAFRRRRPGSAFMSMPAAQTKKPKKQMPRRGAPARRRLATEAQEDRVQHHLASGPNGTAGNACQCLFTLKKIDTAKSLTTGYATVLIEKISDGIERSDAKVGCGDF